MAKRRQKKPRQQAARPVQSAPPPPSPPPKPRSGLDAVTLVTLAGLIAALVVALAGWQKIGFIEQRLEDRLGRIESQVARVIDNAERAAAAAEEPARRRGPDPDRVYEISTAGAPVRGPAGAPITIAEFSDFQ